MSKRVLKSDVKYHFVIDMASLKQGGLIETTINHRRQDEH
jgi:hypothetical protein